MRFGNDGLNVFDTDPVIATGFGGTIGIILPVYGVRICGIPAFDVEHIPYTTDEQINLRIFRRRVKALDCLNGIVEQIGYNGT